MECVGLSVKVVNTATECPETLLKLGLLRLVILNEQLLGLLGEHLDLCERQILRHYFLHLLPDPVDLVIGHEIGFVPPVIVLSFLDDLAVQSARKRVVNHQHLVRIEFPHSVLKHEAKRPHVASSPVRMVIPDELDPVQVGRLETEFLQLVVHQSRQYIVLFPGLPIRDAGTELVRQGLQILSFLNLMVLPVIDAEQCYLILLHFPFLLKEISQI